MSPKKTVDNLINESQKHVSAERGSAPRAFFLQRSVDRVDRVHGCVFGVRPKFGVTKRNFENFHKFHKFHKNNPRDFDNF